MTMLALLRIRTRAKPGHLFWRMAHSNSTPATALAKRRLRRPDDRTDHDFAAVLEAVHRPSGWLVERGH